MWSPGLAGSEWRTQRSSSNPRAKEHHRVKRTMTKSMKVKCAAIVGTVGMLGATAFVASGQTGAYFSDTHTGAISGTIGSIRITPSGGTESNDGSFMDLAFSNMLPGDPQTVTVNYQNTGANTEDVYV